MILKTSYKMKPPISAQIVKGHSLARSLVGCWLFNENPSKLGKVYDLSDNGNTGSLVADCHGVPGKFGSCLDFDGIGDEVICTNFPFIPPPLTIVAWVNLDSGVGTSFYSIIARGGQNEWGTNYDFSIRRQTHEGILYFLWTDADTQYGVSDPVEYDWGVTGWHQVVAIIDESYDGLLYRDGVLLATAGGNSAPTDIRPNLEIGDSETNNNFPGLIDHVLIYNRALSAAEIAHLYCDPFCMFERRSHTIYIPSIGDVTITPVPASKVTATIDPAVIMDLAITPAPASKVTATVDPTVIKGSLSITPAPASKVTATVNPNVIISGEIECLFMDLSTQYWAIKHGIGLNTKL